MFEAPPIEQPDLAAVWVRDLCLKAQGYLLAAAKLKELAIEQEPPRSQESFLDMARWNRTKAVQIIGSAASLTTLILIDEPMRTV